MDWLLWLRGLVAAIINGAATAITTAIVAPDQFNLTTGKGNLISVMVVAAIFGAASYLKQSPLPGAVGEVKK